jgi:hypothetical protein
VDVGVGVLVAVGGADVGKGVGDPANAARWFLRPTPKLVGVPS